MKNYTLLFAWLLVMISNLAVSQTWTWTGTTSDDWSVGSNWSQGSAPGPSSVVSVPSTLADGKPWPRLSGNVTIGSLTLNPGSRLDVNGSGITTAAAVSITGATVKSSAGSIVIEAGGASSLRNSVFEDDLDFTINNAAALNEADLTGRNTFEGNVTFTIASTGTANISTNFRSLFKKNLTIERTAAGATSLLTSTAAKSEAVTGNLRYNNNAGGSTTIGGTSGETIIRGKLDIAVATAGSNPTFTVRRLTNLQGGGVVSIENPGTINLTNDTLTLAGFTVTGKYGSNSNLGDNLFSGTFAYSDATGNTGILYSYGNSFGGPASFSLNGTAASHFYESHNNSAIGNVYKGNAVFTTGSTASLYIGYNRSVTFEADLSVTRTVSGTTDIFTNSGSVGGNFSYTNEAGGSTTIGKSGDVVPVAGKVDLLTDWTEGSSAFNLYGLANQTTGGTIEIKKPGTFNITGNSLVVNEMKILEKNGSNSSLGDNTVSGIFTYSDATGNAGISYSYGNSFEGPASFSLNGTAAGHFYESHGISAIGNVYKGNAVFTTGSTASLYIGYNRSVTFEADLSVTRTASGTTDIFTNGGSIGGNFSYTNEAGGSTTIGKSGDVVPVAGKVDLLTDWTEGSSAFNLYGLANQTTGGTIEIKKPGTFNITGNSLVVNEMKILEKNGSTGSLGDNTVSGTFTYSDATGNAGILYSYGNSFEGPASFSLNGTAASHFYESHNNSVIGNVYKGNAVFTTGSTATLYIGYSRSVAFEANLSVTRTVSGITDIFTNGGSIGGDFSYTNEAGGSTTIGKSGDVVPVAGKIDIVTDALTGTPDFNLYGLANETAGGTIEIKKPGTFNITGNSLVVSEINVLEKNGSSSYLGENTFSGTFTYSDATGNAGILYSYANNFEGAVSFTLNGTAASHFYESHGISANGNVYKGNSTFVRTGDASLNLAFNRVSEFHKDLTITTAAGLTVNSALRFAGSSDGTLQQSGSQGLQLPGLILAKSAAAKLVLNSPVNISGTVSFVNGYIQTDAGGYLNFAGNSASHSGAGDQSHIVGPVRKTGTGAFTFPVGNGTTYHPVALSAPGGTSHVFSAEYKASDPVHYNPGSFETPLEKVSDQGYWDVQRLSGSNGVFLTLSYKVPAGFITELNDLRVAHWSGTSWESLVSITDESSTPTEGMVKTANPVTSFSPFALATTNFLANPLPVKLAAFSVKKEGNAALLQWVTTEEVNSDRFEIERSADTRHWHTAGQVPARGEGDSPQTYSYTDALLLTLDGGSNGKRYYRLKMIDRDGSHSYSDIRSLSVESNHSTKLTVYPNPASDYIHIVPSPTLAPSSNPVVGQVELFDAAGIRLAYPQQVSGDRLDVRGLSPGLYFLTISYAGGEAATCRFVIGK